jgi:hypothetical protein
LIKLIAEAALWWAFATEYCLPPDVSEVCSCRTSSAMLLFYSDRNMFVTVKCWWWYVLLGPGGEGTLFFEMLRPTYPSSIASHLRRTEFFVTFFT